MFEVVYYQFGLIRIICGENALIPILSVPTVLSAVESIYPRQRCLEIKCLEI